MTEDKRKWDCPISHKWEQNESNKDIHWLIMHSPDDEWVNDTQAQLFTTHLKEMGFQNVTKETNIKGGHFEVVEKLGTNDSTKKLLDF
eukprot:CAMPEP_0201508638 /NCGR_PEP_ID=MMETSP0161_2-20130828/1944_1 /ASSEMBLY_ACC=CAM_ASM_000251 /TAXON_ID=180227 /ORGANISM="Neoparamoeba aestuarina, Strain SoJaBio B1-5/56/2" /LENGTH=87 /DNA_ID=CAMNT_0047903367 /DNA_START=540 /DNA_END=800 /DNA_ORIENTATION=-